MQPKSLCVFSEASTVCVLARQMDQLGMMERKRRQRSVFLLASSERSATGARRGTVLTIGKRYSVQPFDTSVAESATDNRPGGRVGAAHDAQAEAESRG